MAERSASTEFVGAVRTEKSDEVQEDDDVDGSKGRDDLGPDSHKADDEDEDLFDQPQFEQMKPEIRKRAKEVYKKPRATIKEIPRSLQEGGEIVVETAVSNDDRPESFLAAQDSKRTSQDKKGVPYSQKGAESSFLLLHAVGPTLEAINMPLPDAYPSEHGFKWVAIDECWKIPDSVIGPIKRTAFKDPSPWEQASRILNKTLGYGGEKINFQRGGCVLRSLRR